MPIAPPKTYAEIILAIRLYRSRGIGARGCAVLCEQSSSYEEAFERAAKRAYEMGREGFSIASTEHAQAEYDEGMEFGASFIAAGTEEYPELLMESPDRPPFLWAKGRIELFHLPTLAIIGSRNPTIDGVRMTANLSRLLGYEGVVIVSGLARGIDAVAHEAAINLGTIGVVAGGLDVLYPKSNAELQSCMFEEGLVVSEMPFGHPPTAKDFPKRNRIIAGLARAVLVIEATLRSGTKITVNDAISLDREIMAVPGHPFAPLSALPNELIACGAHLVRNVDDVLSGGTEFDDVKLRAESLAETEARPIVQHDNQLASDLGRAIIEGRAAAMPDGRVVGFEEKTANSKGL